MTNIVLTAITVILSTNAVEVEEVGIGIVKFRTNVITETHAYEVNGRQFFHVMPPVTNVSRMELRWVESPKERTEQSAVKPKPRSFPILTNVHTLQVTGLMLTAPGATNLLKSNPANCVTRLWDGRTYADAGDTNVNDSLVASREKPPEPNYRRRVDWEIGKPLTSDEVLRLCLPPLPGYVQAMKKPK